jgi:hypothetical protein
MFPLIFLMETLILLFFISCQKGKGDHESLKGWHESLKGVQDGKERIKEGLRNEKSSQKKD